MTMHESFSRDETVHAGSNRSFGVVMTVAIAAISLLNWWRGGHYWRWTGGVALLFLLVTALYPDVLKPLNRLWFRFGLLLHKIVNPIMMGLVFFGAVLPTGIVMRARGKDPLRLKRNSDAESYWIARDPPGPAPESMKDQF